MFADLALAIGLGEERVIGFDHAFEFSENLTFFLGERVTILCLIFFPQYFFYIVHIYFYERLIYWRSWKNGWGKDDEKKWFLAEGERKGKIVSLKGEEGRIIQSK